MKILWVVGIVFFLAGVGMLTGSFFAWRSFADFSAHAKSVDGVVVDLAYLQSSKGRGTYAPVAEAVGVKAVDVDEALAGVPA